MATKIMPGAKAPVSKSDYDRMLDGEVQKALGSTQTTQGDIQVAARRLRALEADLMPSQRAFILDPSRQKAAICTRRAGKTYANRHLAARAVIANPWTERQKAQPVIQYITGTMKKATDLFWTPFKRLCEDIGLEAHWDDHSLRAQFTNGVLVRAGGADDKSELEKYLGDAYPLVLIDEPQSFGPLIEDLVVSKLDAAMIDYDGTIALTGTPGQSKVGMFYDIYCGLAGWSTHKWSYMTNIHLPEKFRTPEYLIEKYGPDALSLPRIQREYFGNWVTDDSELVYRFHAGRNTYDGALPKGHAWRYILGLDLGFRDPCAFVVTAFSRTHPDAFVVHSHSQAHMLPSQIMEYVVKLKAEFPGLMRIMVDTGGSMARNNMEEWILRTGLPMQAADKTKKYDYIEHMNSDMAQGRLKVRPDQEAKLISEWNTLVWEDAESAAENKRHDGKPKEHPGFDNHLCDAALYSWRESLHYRAKSPVPVAVPGDPGYLDAQQRAAKMKMLQDRRNPKFRYQKLFK